MGLCSLNMRSLPRQRRMRWSVLSIVIRLLSMSAELMIPAETSSVDVLFYHLRPANA